MRIPSRSLAGLTALAATTLAAADPMPPAPPALPEGALLVAVVPDLRATLDRVQVAAAPMAGAMPAGTLAGMLGARLGDPGLAKLAPGPVVVVVSEGTPMPGFLALVPTTDVAWAVAQAEAQGLSAQAVGDRVAIGANPWDLDRAEAVAGGIGTQSAGLTADVRLLVPVDRVVNAYGPMMLGFMQMGMAQAPRQKPEVAAVAKMTQAMMTAATLVLPDAGTVQTDLRLEGTVLSMEQVVAPPPGGALAKALVPPPAGVAMLPAPGEGVVVMTARYEARGAGDWIQEVFRRLAADPRTKDLVAGEFANVLREQMGLATGQMAMAVSGTAAMCQSGIFGHRDAAQIRVMQRRLVEAMRDEFFGTIYRAAGLDMRAAGLDMRWESDVRRIAGRPVDRFLNVRSATATMPVPDMPPMDIVVLPERMVWSQDPALLDALVAGTVPVRPLAAQGRFPDMDGWMDVDVAGYMRLSVAMQGAANPMLAPMLKAMETVPAGERTSIGWRTGEGRLQARVRIPLEPCYALAKALQAAARPSRPTQDL